MTSVAAQWVRVGKASCGKGVFARQQIPNGTMVGPVEGQVIDDPEYTSSHCIDLGGTCSLEPRAPFRYLNHCCTPNCCLCIHDAFYEDGTPAPAEVSIEAICEIPKGAELTIDYRWSADGAIKCLCGSAGCRGWVVDADELPKLLESKKQTSRQPC